MSRPMLLAGGLLLALPCMQVVQAHGHALYDQCNYTDSGTVTAHVVGNFEHNSKKKDPLTDWIEIPHPQAWTCTRYTSHPSKSIEVLVKNWMPPVLQHAFKFEGETYDVYQALSSTYTHHSGGLGFIMKRRYTIESSSGYSWHSPWLPVRHDNAGGAHPPALKHFLALPNKATYLVSLENQVRLFNWASTSHHKPSQNFPKTGEVTEFEVTKHQYWTAHSDVPARKRFSRIRAWFNRNDKTCTTLTAEKTVYLPTVGKDKFTDIGSTAGLTGFNLDLINCSENIKGIEYKLLPVRFVDGGHRPTALQTNDWSTVYANGTLSLSQNSSAKGVGIQILESGNPVKFDRTSRLVVPGYSKGDTSASIPLQARYIQTEADVTAGTVYATMTVLYMYK